MDTHRAVKSTGVGVPSWSRVRLYPKNTSCEALHNKCPAGLQDHCEPQLLCTLPSPFQMAASSSCVDVWRGRDQSILLVPDLEQAKIAEDPQILLGMV